MTTSRNDPDSPENQRMSRENDAYVAMLRGTYECPKCGFRTVLGELCRSCASETFPSADGEWPPGYAHPDQI